MGTPWKAYVLLAVCTRAMRAYLHGPPVAVLDQSEKLQYLALVLRTALRIRSQAWNPLVPKNRPETFAAEAEGGASELLPSLWQGGPKADRPTS